MRMRNKPWVKPELESSPFYIDDPFQKGNWNAKFPRKQPLYLELGCGKGNFIAELAATHPEINYLGIDMKSIVLASGCRHVKQAFANAGREKIDNVILTAYDIERILNIMSKDDLVDRLYINFCNPWPKERQNKKRLTHTRQLEKYKVFLKDGAELRFKTDDDELFEATLEYLKESGFELILKTYDLHSLDHPDVEQIMTEHEKKFTEMGIKTKFLIARYHKTGDPNLTPYDKKTLE
ncbi:MAG: tRNA (guanosine(46)-N7)-methyltransferase TrmB [Massiliimalia sp.]|jgi:tRNA (guanine-N7-)-methyltransferase